MTQLRTNPVLLSCPACGREVTAAAVYEVVSTEPLPVAKDTPAPLIGQHLHASLRLTGLRIDHTCGTALPQQRGQAGAIVNQPLVGGGYAAAVDGLRDGADVARANAEVAAEVRRRAALAAGEPS